jgi:hypothetical protein
VNTDRKENPILVSQVEGWTQYAGDFSFDPLDKVASQASSPTNGQWHVVVLLVTAIRVDLDNKIVVSGQSFTNTLVTRAKFQHQFPTAERRRCLP